MIVMKFERIDSTFMSEEEIADRIAHEFVNEVRVVSVTLVEEHTIRPLWGDV